MLVRYADDFVVMCRTKRECEEAGRRIRVILGRLGLELHPNKTKRVNFYDGEEGLDSLGCHLHKRKSGTIWEKKGQRVYFLNRWPSWRSIKRVRQRVRELTRRVRCHEDTRNVIANLNPILRGWWQNFRTGNASPCFNQIDSYVWRRLKRLRMQRKERHLSAGEAERWTRDFFYDLGLYRSRGTVRCPEPVFREAM